VSVDRCWIARPEINQNLENVRKQGLQLKKPYKVEVEVTLTGSVKYAWNSRHAAGGFRQVHDAQNEKLRNWIVREISSSPVLYDLFGGWGNLSIPLVDKMSEIHCVDLSTPVEHPPHVPAHLHFHQAPVLEWLQEAVSRIRPEKEKKAVAILDPPREGLAEHFQEIAQALKALGVQEIIAVGCDPDAWARDVGRWIKQGWKLEKVMVIDLFPQTSHIESVGLLRNSGH
jgi:tRNA/tmRNA/rRNA uracil-C5-methylase (TrmA/RlmC/RlmD family)